MRTYIKIAAIIALAVAVGIITRAVYSAGKNAARVELTAQMQALQTTVAEQEQERLETIAAMSLQHAEDVARVQQVHEQEARKVTDDYAKRLAEVDRKLVADSNKRLRLPATVCRPPPADPPTVAAADLNATDSGTVVLPEPIERNLRRLVAECARVAAVAHGLQEFERSAIAADTVKQPSGAQDDQVAQ